MTELESINLKEEDLFIKIKMNFNIQLIYLKINGDKKYIRSHIKNKRILG
jgi:uncharacterized protein YueI